MAPDERAQVSSQIITNPLSGEQITIQATSADTGGRVLEWEPFLPPVFAIPHMSPSCRSAASPSSASRLRPAKPPAGIAIRALPRQWHAGCHAYRSSAGT